MAGEERSARTADLLVVEKECSSHGFNCLCQKTLRVITVISSAVQFPNKLSHLPLDLDMV